MKFLATTFILFFAFQSYSQEKNYSSEDVTINQFISGTLFQPNQDKKSPLAIIIPGSGPIDRDGNQNFSKNNSLKKLAEALADKGIATFRFDKRVVKQIQHGNVDANIKFEDFVTDVNSIIDYFSKKGAFTEIILIGHSQGSLVGLLADNQNVDKIVSISGAGQSMDNVLLTQISKMAPGLTDDAAKTLAILKDGKTTPSYPKPLESIFRYDLQPFMISWMKYEPTEVISKIDKPILVINGTKDLQVSVEEAELLKESAPNAELKIIDGMNHIMFTIDGDDLVNAKSYNESFHTINPELIESIQKFIFSK